MGGRFASKARNIFYEDAKELGQIVPPWGKSSARARGVAGLESFGLQRAEGKANFLARKMVNLIIFLVILAAPVSVWTKWPILDLFGGLNFRPKPSVLAVSARFSRFSRFQRVFRESKFAYGSRFRDLREFSAFLRAIYPSPRMFSAFSALISLKILTGGD